MPAPIPAKRPSTRKLFGETLVDEYAWLRQRDLNKDEMLLFPGPTWTGVRRNPTISGAGGVIAFQLVQGYRTGNGKAEYGLR